MTADYTFGDIILQAKNVNLNINNKTILRDINFSIKDIKRKTGTTGQVVSILGPSGIGKTQLFKVISGLKPQTSGDVLLHGKPVVAGQVGVVAQSYPLFRHLTVEKNLKLVSKNKELQEQWLTDFDLLDKKDVYPSELSGGQKQRVAILQQLLCSEHYLLLDEPFSGLDHINETKVMNTLLKIAHSDELNTLIIITHDVTAATLISDHIWLMGREHKNNEVIPGARIIQEINLIDLDLAWQQDIEYSDKFIKFVRDVKKLFTELV